ncbi:MAG: hypothetical protein ACJ76J_12725 [Thermoanaerobaculia bacterium]
MKTTLEIPDGLYRKAKATAALGGQSLKDFVADALKSHLERHASGGSTQRGWRAVFGKARREDVEAVEAIMAAELERIDLEEWR